MTQIFIIVFSSLALVLLTRTSFQLRRWGPVAGLIAQPFWIYDTWSHEQWGMFALSIAYALVYVHAVLRDFRASALNEPAWLGCIVPPTGWWCSRVKGHSGPCAARPD